MTYPCPLSQAVETELVGDLGSVHGILWQGQKSELIRVEFGLEGGTYRQILLVGEDQEDSIPQLVLVQHALQLLTGLDDTVAIVGVDDEDDTLGVLEVMSPQGTDLVLTTDIPNGELDVLVLDSLDVEACVDTSLALNLLWIARGACKSDSDSTNASTRAGGGVWRHRREVRLLCSGKGGGKSYQW